LTNRDSIEEALRKELRDLKKSLEEAKTALASAEQEKQLKIANDQQLASQMHKSELEAAQIQIQSLLREVSTLKTAADNTSLIKKNQQLTEAVIELDKAFAKSEKQVSCW
jgi:hypothetical protein